MINNGLRRKAVKIARRLPKKREDAEIVVALLADLIEWVHPLETRRGGFDFSKSRTACSSLGFKAKGKPDGSPK
jgi:hypothetical protein